MPFSAGQITHNVPFGVPTMGNKLEKIEGVHKFGYNSAVSTSFETVWDGGGIYAHPSSAVAMTLTSGAGATDNGVEVTVQGLDSSYNFLEETVTLAGSGTATTTALFHRVNRAFVNNGQAPTDDITIANGGTTYAQITHPYNQTLMCVYTIPAGYVGYVTQVSASVQKNQECVLQFIARKPNGVFRTLGVMASFGTPVDRKFDFPFHLEEKTDVEIRAKAGATTEIAGEIEILLDKN